MKTKLNEFIKWPILGFAVMVICAFVPVRELIHIPDKLTRTKEDPNIYESQGMYHSAYLILNTDSSFVYYKVYEVGFNFCVGNYKNLQGELVFNWDSIKTLNAVNDTAIYRQYSRYRRPRAGKITGVRYVPKGDTLVRIQN